MTEAREAEMIRLFTEILLTSSSGETGSCTQDTIGESWTSINAIPNNGHAQVDLGHHDESSTIIAKGFTSDRWTPGPPTGNVLGVQVRYTAGIDAGGAGDIVLYTLMMTKSSTNNSATVNQADDSEVDGSPATKPTATNDKWGANWSASDFTNVDFGVLFRLENYDGRTVKTAYCSKIEVIVHTDA